MNQLACESAHFLGRKGKIKIEKERGGEGGRRGGEEKIFSLSPPFFPAIFSLSCQKNEPARRLRINSSIAKRN